VACGDCYGVSFCSDAKERGGGCMMYRRPTTPIAEEWLAPARAAVAEERKVLGRRRAAAARMAEAYQAARTAARREYEAVLD
jgi:hypothetical protein